MNTSALAQLSWRCHYSSLRMEFAPFSIPRSYQIPRLAFVEFLRLLRCFRASHLIILTSFIQKTARLRNLRQKNIRRANLILFQDDDGERCAPPPSPALFLHFQKVPNAAPEWKQKGKSARRRRKKDEMQRRASHGHFVRRWANEVD